MYINLYICIYISMYMYIFVCVCVCLSEPFLVTLRSRVCLQGACARFKLVFESEREFERKRETGVCAFEH